MLQAPLPERRQAEAGDLVHRQPGGDEAAAAHGEVRRVAGRVQEREAAERRLHLGVLPRSAAPPASAGGGWGALRLRRVAFRRERHPRGLVGRPSGLRRVPDREGRRRELREPDQPLHGASRRSSREQLARRGHPAGSRRQAELLLSRGGRARSAQRRQGEGGGDGEGAARARRQRGREEPPGSDAAARGLLRAIGSLRRAAVSQRGRRQHQRRRQGPPYAPALRRDEHRLVRRAAATVAEARRSGERRRQDRLHGAPHRRLERAVAVRRRAHLGRRRHQRDHVRRPVRVERHTEEDTGVLARVPPTAGRLDPADPAGVAQSGVRDEAALRHSLPQQQSVRDQLHKHLRAGAPEGPVVASAGDGLPAPEVGEDSQALPLADPPLRDDGHMHDHLRADRACLQVLQSRGQQLQDMQQQEDLLPLQATGHRDRVVSRPGVNVHHHTAEGNRLHGAQVGASVLLQHRQRVGRRGDSQHIRHVFHLHRAHLRLAELRGRVRHSLRVDQPDADGGSAASFRHLRRHVHPHPIRIRQALIGVFRIADRLHHQLLCDILGRARVRQSFHRPDQGPGDDGRRVGL